MREFIERIENAKTIKKIEKVRQEALTKYGLLSSEYGKIINLCYKRYEEIKGVKQ